MAPPESAPPAIELIDVTLRYPRQKKPALDGVSVSIPQNALCGLLGRNAAGKTSLMALLAAFRRPTAGSVRLWGQDPFESPQAMSEVAFVYQWREEGFASYCKPRELFAMAAHMRPRWDNAFATRLAERFDVPMRKSTSRLSKGQQAAVRCILGLAARAPLTIFDEAYLGMDAVYRKVFVDELLQDYLKYPRTILFSTHYISEMERLFTEALMLDEGRVLLHDDCDVLRAKGMALQDLFISLTLKEGESYE
jgi:ABC-2 type transport system ATP-binding protein